MNNHNSEKKKNQEDIVVKSSKKKLRSEQIEKYAVNIFSPGNFQRLKECGSFISFMANYDLSQKKVHSILSCKNRFCAFCAWRQAKKDALKIDVLMKYIEAEKKKAFIFLTLTIPNVRGEDLQNAITEFNKAFKRLVQLDDVRAMNKGYIRKLEITYNAERGDYHPHFHVIMAVNKSYFKDKTYIKQQKWLNLWRASMRDESITQVDVRRIKRETAGKEQAELAKYAAKDSDMTVSQEVFNTFYMALKGRQVLTYNGVFADANKLYKLGELDKYKQVDETVYVYLLLYTWGKGKYIETERRELTPEEILKYNKQLIDEKDIE